MTGSLFALGLTLLMSVACASPLIDDSYESINNVDYALSWFPNDFASDSNGVGVQFQQFTGYANVIHNSLRFEGSPDDTYLYLFNGNGLTSLHLVTDLIPYNEICAYFESNNAFAGLLVYYSDDGVDITITPYWRAYIIEDRLNASFWGFVQEDTLNTGEVYLTSYSIRERANMDDQFSFDCRSYSYSGTLLPYILGGQISVDIEIFNPSTNFDFFNFYFLVGARTDDDSSYYRQGYNAGYSDGQSAGYNTGYTEGQSAGYTEGYRVGSQDGYREGYYAGISLSGNDFHSLFNAIADTPILMIRSLFNFDLFGMNVFVAIMTMLTGIVVIYVVKKVIH